MIDESERLNRFIANLLDTTKLESGAIVPNAAPHDVGEIVGSALRRRQDPQPSQGVPGAQLQSADAGARCRAVRAGAVQPARQRRQIRSRRYDDFDPGRARSGNGLAADHRPRGRHPAGGIGECFRQVLSCRKASTSVSAPASGSRFRAASSRRCAARSQPAIVPIVLAPSSPCACRSPAASDKLDTAA